jgi:hypothetical protein
MKTTPCKVEMGGGSQHSRLLGTPETTRMTQRRYSVADNRYLLRNAMMQRLNSFHSWRWAIVFLVTVALPASAFEQQGPKNRGGAINMIIQSKIVSDALLSAEQISRALSQSGYKADFSLESLKQVDRFFEEQVANGQPKPGGLLSQQLGARLFAIGAYVGEVIRRQNGGEWQSDDNDPQAEINIAVRLQTGVILWPVQRVMKRFKNGAEDGIWIYGAAAPASATRQ